MQVLVLYSISKKNVVLVHKRNGFESSCPVTHSIQSSFFCPLLFSSSCTVSSHISIRDLYKHWNSELFLNYSHPPEFNVQPRCLYADTDCASSPHSKWMWVSDRVGVFLTVYRWACRGAPLPARCLWRALQRRASAAVLGDEVQRGCRRNRASHPCSLVSVLLSPFFSAGC